VRSAAGALRIRENMCSGTVRPAADGTPRAGGGAAATPQKACTASKPERRVPQWILQGRTRTAWYRR